MRGERCTDSSGRRERSLGSYTRLANCLLPLTPFDLRHRGEGHSGVRLNKETKKLEYVDLVGLTDPKSGRLSMVRPESANLSEQSD